MGRILALENGDIFTGEELGASGETIGEIVFNTGMTGYQEVMTDPSYCGQIVAMTYPLIGNYGINDSDSESSKPQIKGLIVREACSRPSNFRSLITLDEYLKNNNIIGIQGIDTRALTLTLRKQGTMKGIIAPEEGFEYSHIKSRILDYNITDPVMQVSGKEIKKYRSSGDLNIGLLDLGTKGNIIRELLKRGANVTVLPADTSSSEIMDLGFDGLVLSNGPGDPKDTTYAIKTISELAGRIPIFGICLGHQLSALALGCDTHKLKYGHRGANHPVKDLSHDRTYITSQNHGYAVSMDSLDKGNMELTHINLNDGTVEGFRCTKIPLFTVQFHPEASPGPTDTSYLFDDFIDMIGAENAKKK
jgi:carbamoyl-phosphate synthase small subunit